MSEAKFTPWPWTRQGRQIRAVVDGQEIAIAAAKLYIRPRRPGVMGADIEQAVANARLIAAAPDLYAELRRLEWSHGDVCPSCAGDIEAGHRADCRLAAVLAKVAGEDAR